MNALEKQVAKQVVQCFLDAGYGVGVAYDDGIAFHYSKDLAEVMDHIGHADEEYILARTWQGSRAYTVGYAFLIFDNHASELVADCTTNVEAILQPAFDLQETFQH